MTTSSSVNFSMTRNEIITDALLMIGALGEEQTIENSTLQICDRALNRLIKHFENQAIHIWKRTEAVVFLQQDQSIYTFGSGSTDHATETYLEMVTTADALSGASTVSVSDSTGVSVSDYIGIVLDDGSLHWAVVSGTTATTISFAATPLTDDVTTGNTLFTYTTKINKPIDIYQVRSYLIDGETEIDLGPDDSYEEFQALSNKNVSGSSPTQWNYHRGRTTGTLRIYPALENVTRYLKITYAKPLEDLDSASDEADVPQEWLDYLTHKLAVRLMPGYGKLGSAQYAQLYQATKDLESEVLAFDNEKSTVQIMPDNK